jgi:UDP-3-O-[3-hydroxymyristoyl] glucosamine N-acyltransferase
MADKRFYKESGYHKLSEIVRLLNCQVDPALHDRDNITIHGVKPLEEANEGDLSFLSNKKYITQFKSTKASACIVPEDFIAHDTEVTLLKAKNPYFAYTKLVDLFYSRAKTYSSQIMPSAYISHSASIGKNCYIGHNVVIEDNAIIGDNCIIESGTVIDFGVVIGNRATIYSNVSISYSIIGDDVVILAGARIGQDGFGFATEAGIHHKIFHTGVVKIGNNVEIGANTTIDRGSINDTIIEE